MPIEWWQTLLFIYGCLWLFMGLCARSKVCLWLKWFSHPCFLLFSVCKWPKMVGGLLLLQAVRLSTIKVAKQTWNDSQKPWNQYIKRKELNHNRYPTPLHFTTQSYMYISTYYFILYIYIYIELYYIILNYVYYIISDGRIMGAHCRNAHVLHCLLKIIMSADLLPFLELGSIPNSHTNNPNSERGKNWSKTNGKNPKNHPVSPVQLPLRPSPWVETFPECVARVPVSLWGSGGWSVVRSTLRPRPQPFATVRNRPQPFATVRNRSQPFARTPYGRAYGKFCRGGPFWRFQTSGCFVSRGRRGTSWHSDVFCNVSKVVSHGRQQYFCDVFRRCVAVFVAGAALWACPSSFFVAGAAL